MKPIVGAALLACACGSAAGVPTAREPAAPLLELRVRAPAPGARTLVLEIENEGARSVPLPGARARVEVRRDGEPARECSATDRAYETLSDDASLLAPGEARRFVAELPCALEGPGEYALLVDVALAAGDGEPSPIEDHLAGSTRLRVPPSLPGAERSG